MLAHQLKTVIVYMCVFVHLDTTCGCALLCVVVSCRFSWQIPLAGITQCTVQPPCGVIFACEEQVREKKPKSADTDGIPCREFLKIMSLWVCVMYLRTQHTHGLLCSLRWLTTLKLQYNTPGLFFNFISYPLT